MPNPEDITDPTTAMNMTLTLMAKAFKLNYSTPTNNNQRISSNPHNRQIAQPGMNMGQDRQMQMVGGNGENQFRQYAGQNVGNLNGYNTIQNVRNQVVQNPRVQNIGNQNGLIGVPGNANQNLIGNGNLVAARAEENAAGHNGNQIRCYNYRGVGHFTRNCTVRPRRRDAAYLQTKLLIAQKEEAGIQLQAEEFDLMATAADLDKIEKVNANCILMANRQQASTSGTQTDKAPVYDSDGSAEVHDYANCNDNEIFNMFIQEERYTELLEPIPEPRQVPQNDHNVISENDLRNSQLVVFCSPRASQTVKDENFPIVNQVDTKVQNFETQFLKEAAKFVGDFKYLAKEADDWKLKIERLLRAVFSQDIMFVVQKEFVVDTLNLQTELELTNERFENSYKDIQQKIERLRAQLGDLKGKSKDTSGVSDTLNHLSQKLENENVELEFQTTLRPEGHNLGAIQRMIGSPSASKSSRSKNKGVKVEDHHRNLLLSKNSKHMLSACNNFKLDSQNVYSKVVCAMCKQCLISVNHDQCLLNYVYDKNSRGKKQTANISIKENQKKRKPKVKKPKKVGFIKRLATPKPSKPRSFLRWSSTGRMFDLNGKITASSESKSQSDCSKGDNACTFNPVEPKIKRLPNSTSLLGRNDLVSGLPKFKYHKEHPCPSCEQGKSKRAPHPTKPVPNSRQRLHLFHLDLCGPMRIASINGKRYVLVIVDDYSRYTWVHFLRSKDEAPEVIKTFLTRITVLLQSPVISIRTDNDTEFKNHVLKEYFDSIGISHQMSSFRTPQQNGVVEQRNWTLVEAARTMLIFSRASLFLWAEVIATACFTQNRSIIHRHFNKTPYELINGKKPDISFLHVFGALFYPKNDREDIGKLGAKGDIGFFIGYSADSCAYRIYNRRTKKIMETMNVSFDELSTMAFEQRSLKPRLQSMTSGQISSGLDLTYAPSTITSQQPTEGELDLLFEAMYDDYIDTAPTPTNSSSLAKNFPITSQDVDELNSQQQHVQQQGNQAHLQSKTVADDVPNAMFDANTFVNPFANPSISAVESSSSQNVDPSNMHTFYQPYPHEFQWTKDHPLEQNVKEAMTDPAWIESMQEEFFQFKRLDVWVLVPALDNISPLTLKWIRRWLYNLIPAESRFKTTCSIYKDTFKMKAQVHVSKSSANLWCTSSSSKGTLLTRYQSNYWGRLLASFQDLEHEGGDTRSQGGIKFKDKGYKDLYPRSQACKWIFKRIPKNTRLQVSRRLKKDSQLNDHPLGGDC
uniref:Integrase, catalytic region, zinc finger, CCHC-type, peptidase aspartic, catalytic n=1 Tax=Tanacetum cinerariifolium TaxID=118510 RepID=A0A6L2LS79_TANCI|nr:integrase, catalytic region, zinc finger, CCHC-type, peptidase aspartic, catalytic [Tanacetum cinerariifolium]